MGQTGYASGGVACPKRWIYDEICRNAILRMKCNLCDKVIFCPYHVTEKDSKGKWETSDLCIPCAIEYLSNFSLSVYPITTPPPIAPSPEQGLDLTEIKSTEDLLAFITDHQHSQKEPCPKCGLMLKEFDDKGRFGCPDCYNHFTECMEELVYPYHGSREHVGKIPKYTLDEDNKEERKKLLKLRMAKAVELELYEEAAEIKKQLDVFIDPESLA